MRAVLAVLVSVGGEGLSASTANKCVDRPPVKPLRMGVPPGQAAGIAAEPPPHNRSLDMPVAVFAGRGGLAPGCRGGGDVGSAADRLHRVT